MNSLDSIQNIDGFKNAEIIFSLAPTPMWIFDLQTLRFLAVNREAIRQYGYTEKEFLSMTIKDIRPKEDLPRLEKAIDTARSRTKSYTQSLFRHKKKDGSIMFVNIKSNLINYKQRKAEIVTSIDLTQRYFERKKLENQHLLLKTIERVNKVLLKKKDLIPAMFECFDIVGQILQVDQISFFQNIPGERTISQKLKWDKNIPLNSKEINFLTFPESHFSTVLKKIENGYQTKIIISNLPPSSTKSIFQKLDFKILIAVPLIIKDSLIGFIGFHYCSEEIDILPHEKQIIKTLAASLHHFVLREKIQQELKNREYKFRSLVQKGFDLIAIIDHNGIYKYVSSSSEEILGIQPNEFLEKNAFDFIHPDDVSRVKNYLQEILEKKIVLIPPYKFRDEEGDWIYLETKLTNLLDDPIISGIVANSRVVTEEVKKKQEQQLLQTISRIIGQPGNLRERLNEALRTLLEDKQFCIGEAWIKSQNDLNLDLRAFHYRNSEFDTFYESDSNIVNFPFEMDLGDSLRMKQFMVWENLNNNEIFIREKAAKKAGLNLALGIPIIYNEEFLGCFILFSKNNRKEIKWLEEIFSSLGIGLGSTLKQKLIEEEYRNFFEISPDPHCIIGFDGFLKKCNNAFVDLLGFNREELIENSIYKFIYKEDRSKIVKKIESLKLDYPSQNFEARFISHDGEIKWLVWKVTKQSDAKIFIAVAKDVTDQKLAEQKLEKIYNQLKKAQKIARLGYWIKDINSPLFEWNEETYKIFGYTPKNFIPSTENITKLFPSEDRYLIESNPLEILQLNKVKGFEHRIINKNGKIRWVRQEVQLIPNGNSKSIQIEGIIQDITERKEYQEQLILSNERFKLAMLASNEMIWEINHRNNSIIRGKGYQKLFGYRISEPYNKSNSWWIKIHPDDMEKTWLSYQQSLANREKVYWKGEYRVIHEGSILYFIDSCYIYRNETGTPIRSIGSALDVTNSRKQLEKIKLQNKKLREIAWIQSHVIRAPLARIMGLIEIGIDYDWGGKSPNEILEMISVSANELDLVIRDIADKTNSIDNDNR